MCTGLEIAALASVAGSALAAGGGIMQANEASENQARIADARNRELQATLQRTKKLSKESRDIYKTREQQIEPEKAAQNQADATADRTATLEGAIPESAPEEVPLSGSAPTVVKSEIAKKMLAATGEAKEQARALGKVGGYGDNWFQQGLYTNDADRRLGIPQNFISQEMALLPQYQDYAEYSAYKPSSGFGEIMQGAGNLIASAGGAYGGRKAPSATGPLGWQTTVYS
jgi:hypothetical protein